MFDEEVYEGCRELTEEQLIQVNGGAKVKNTNEGVANAQVGDTVTRNNGETVEITQGDIDWAKAHVGNSGGKSENGGKNSSGSNEHTGSETATDVKETTGTPSESAGNNSDGNGNSGRSYNGSNTSSISGSAVFQNGTGISENDSSSSNSSNQNYTPALTPQQQHEMAKADAENHANISTTTVKTENITDYHAQNTETENSVKIQKAISNYNKMYNKNLKITDSEFLEKFNNDIKFREQLITLERKEKQQHIISGERYFENSNSDLINLNTIKKMKIENKLRKKYENQMNIPDFVSINKNVEKANNMTIIDFYYAVRNKGIWDYKQKGDFEDFGNFNFGVTGKAAGIPDTVLLRGAGWAQERAGTSLPSWGHWWKKSPYGDDPNDQQKILEGIAFYNENFR